MMNNNIQILIEALRRGIRNDTQWLTRDDQDAIEIKIDELYKFVDGVYTKRKNSITF